MLNTQTLVMRLYEESRWTPSAGAARKPAEPAPAAAPVPLPAADPEWTLSRALERRAAAYAYADAPVPAAKLHAVLRAGARDAEPGVELHLFAWRVEGVAPGTYRFDPARGALVPLGPAPDPVRDGPGLLLQAEFAGAAALVFAVGDLGAAVEAEGGAGHRRLLMRAGAALQRAWMHAAGSGLAGCIFAAFYRRAVHARLGVDGLTRVAAAALALGLPTGEDA